MASSKKKPAPAKRKPAKRVAKPATAGSEVELFLAQGRKVEPGCVTYILRTCAADMTAYNGFVWPSAGAVECPDWKRRAECGNGLHGLLMGDGNASLTSSETDAKWLVAAVWAADVVDIDGDKVKAPRAWVVFCGERHDAVAEITRLGATKPIYGVHQGGNRSTLTGGDGSTLTGGNCSTLTGGNRSTLTGGDGSTLTGGDGSTLKGGNCSTLKGGNRSTLTGGDGSTLTGGYGSTLTGGDGSTLKGGEDTALVFLRWNGRRYKLHVAQVGENGVLPDRWYRVDDNGSMVLVDDAEMGGAK